MLCSLVEEGQRLSFFLQTQGIHERQVVIGRGYGERGVLAVPGEIDERPVVAGEQKVPSLPVGVAGMKTGTIPLMATIEAPLVGET